MSDYLWDKDGEDPEVERLERMLSPLGYRGGAPQLPRRRSRLIWISAAAALALSALAVALLLLRPAPPRGWAATVGGSETRLAIGVWLAPDSPAQLRIEGIGTIDLEAGTRVRITNTNPKLHELDLDHGTLSVKITAPPRTFVIATPRARIIDLGCAYRLTVDSTGAGKLIVTEGSVAIADPSGHETVVRAGAESQLATAPPPAEGSMPTHAPAPAQGPAPALQPAHDSAPAPTAVQAPPHAAAPSKIKGAHKKNATKSTQTPTQPKAVPAQAPAKSKIAPAPPPATGVKLNHDPFKDIR